MIWYGGVGGWGGNGQQGASSGEVGGKEAERLVLVGGQWRAVALEGARDAAAGGARAVAEGLDAALPLQLCRGERKRGREGGRGERPQIRCLHNDKKDDSAVGSESSLRSV